MSYALHLNNVGSSSQPFDDVNLTGFTVAVGEVYVNGNYNIANTSTLTLQITELVVDAYGTSRSWVW